MYRSMVLVIAALSSVQASATDLPSVYVAPGGVYIASARVYVAPGVGNGEPPYAAPGPAYAPGYVTPRPAYRAPAVYGATRSAYPPPPVYIEREPAYLSDDAAEFAPRPPDTVPYNGGGRCSIDRYGRLTFCD
jgi:hypothetical protein